MEYVIIPIYSLFIQILTLHPSESLKNVLMDIKSTFYVSFEWLSILDLIMNVLLSVEAEHITRIYIINKNNKIMLFVAEI